MKKGKLTMTVIIGLICFILVYIMFIQFRTVEKTDISGIENMRETELRESLSDWKIKQEEANKQLESINEKLEEYKQKIETNENATELLYDEIERCK